ncbi:MAG: protein-L-isoaspartate O-methyltransferase [Rhodobacteraceae bacterium]|nr:protein-L-isoaspartate O-methyltransferase [Paracoccaceae bacterium]
MSDFAARRLMMVDTQVRPSDVTKFPIIDAMLTVQRELFVPRDKREAAYIGKNVGLGDGRVLLEARSLAKMLDALDLQKTDLVLDIGAGLGYSAAVMARMSEAVVALEDTPERIAEAQDALTEAEADNVILQLGHLVEGAAQHGPYDVIVIEGAVEMVPPGLVAQLKEGGRIACIFSDAALGTAKIGYKLNGRVTWRALFNAGAPLLPGFQAARDFAL